MGLTKDLGSIPRAITVDSSNRVGIGTTTPTSAKLQVSGNNGSAIGYFYNNSGALGNVPGVIIEAGTNSSDYALNVASSLGVSRLYVRGDGNVGIGTTSPGSPLQVAGGSYPVIQIQGGTTGGGGIRMLAGTENYAEIFGEYESANNGMLIFRTRATGSVSERMRITSGGNVGIGTTSAPNRVTIQGPAQGIALSWTDALSNTGYLRIRAGAAAVGADDILLLETAGTARLTILANGNYFFSGTNISDSRAKHNIKDLEFNFLEKIIALQPKSYHMKYDLEKIKYGFIAQEVNEVLPDLIGGDLEGEDFVGLDYDGLIPVLVGAIKELQQQINNLKNGN